MKLITPIWSDPIGWSEQVAKTPLRVVSWIIVHIILVVFGLTLIYLYVRSDLDPGLKLMIILGAGSPIFFIGVVFPAFYLYAIYRLLKLTQYNK
jgi:hypothetical protein